MKFIKNNILIFVLIAICLLVFRSWLQAGDVSGGDYPFGYVTKSNLPSLIYAWSIGENFGLGGYLVPFLWGYLPLMAPIILLGKIGLAWGQIERIAHFYPFLIISVVSSWYSFSKIFKEKWQVLSSSLIFLLNTFVLMLIGGGLVIMGMAYSLIPLIFVVFRDIFQNSDRKKILILGLLLGIQVTLDLRLGFITGIILLFYFLINLSKGRLIKNFTNGFILPGIIAALINSYWLLPLIGVRENPLSQVGEVYTGTGILQFLSFTKFENAISLLHPNWPENIFGKVSFLKPEFLILPILAFSALLFVHKVKKEEKSLIIFAVVVSLFGIFMAKGSNPPFGEIYTFLYKTIPGFQLFRDSSKWFIPIAFGYAILIPRVLENIGILKQKLKLLIFVVFTFYLIFLIRPAFFGQLTGLLRTTNIPSDYYAFKEFIQSENDYFRIGWFPTFYKYGYSSAKNYPIFLRDVFLDYNNKPLANDISKNKLFVQESGIKYIVIPHDFTSEVFLSDRKYNENVYQQAVTDLEKISWLKKVKTFGKIVVFEVPGYKDHFWSTESNLHLTYQYKNPTKYLVSVENAKKGDRLIFSESFDQKWVIKDSFGEIHSTLFDKRFNSFILPKDGNYSFEVYYTPQIWVEAGTIVSVISIGGVCFLLLKFKKDRTR